MQPCDGKWPIPLAAGKVISTQSMQETFSRILQEHYRDTCTGEHVKQEKRNGGASATGAGSSHPWEGAITEGANIPELRQLRNYINYGGKFFCEKILSYANYVITSITEAIFCGKSGLRQLRNYINYGGKFFWKKNLNYANYVNYGLRRQFF